METDLPSLKNSDQVVWITEDHGPSQVRSYECTFCRRGFSNAQALGGHMNIHRRDKAKLKQHSTDCQLSLDITDNNSSNPPDQSKSKSELEFSSEEKICKLKCPSIIPPDDDDIVVAAEDQSRVEALRQLPLFVDEPSRRIEDRKSGNHGSDGVELDLELRLGPETHNKSTTMGKIILNLDFMR